MRFRFRLVSPRAAAHVWGKGARILTEINRLTQLIPQPNCEIAAGTSPPVCRKTLLSERSEPGSPPILPAVLSV